MLRLVIRRIHPQHLDALREWLHEANGPRRAEALATLRDEGCAHERAVLIEEVDQPVLVYAMQVEDERRSARVAAASDHPIDAEHKRIMALAASEVDGEVLLDLRP